MDDVDLALELAIGVDTGVITTVNAKRIIAELRKALKKPK